MHIQLFEITSILKGPTDNQQNQISTFDRPRPDLVSHATAVYTAGFPSGHAMLAASTYLTLGVLLAQVQRRRRVKAYILFCAVLATLLVDISRIYLGVHLADRCAWPVGLRVQDGLYCAGYWNSGY